jgi:uncharacterized lipoprotein YbaY
MIGTRKQVSKAAKSRNKFLEVITASGVCELSLQISFDSDNEPLQVRYDQRANIETSHKLLSCVDTITDVRETP